MQQSNDLTHVNIDSLRPQQIMGCASTDNHDHMPNHASEKIGSILSDGCCSNVYHFGGILQNTRNSRSHSSSPEERNLSSTPSPKPTKTINCQNRANNNMNAPNECPALSPSKRYARRKRHKTKPQKYEFNRNAIKHKKPNDEEKIKRSHVKRRKTEPGLNEAFNPSNVKPARLTLKRTHKRGLFSKGKSSTEFEHRDLPDLSFCDISRLLQRGRRVVHDYEDLPCDRSRSEAIRSMARVQKSGLCLCDADSDSLKESSSQQVNYSRSPRLRNTHLNHGDSNAGLGCEQRLDCPLHKHKHLDGNQRRTASRLNDDCLSALANMQARRRDRKDLCDLLHPSPQNKPVTTTAQSQVIKESSEDCGDDRSKPVIQTSLSPEAYTRRALIRDQPGIWRDSEYDSNSSIYSVADLRALAERIDADQELCENLQCEEILHTAGADSKSHQRTEEFKQTAVCDTTNSVPSQASREGSITIARAQATGITTKQKSPTMHTKDKKIFATTGSKHQFPMDTCRRRLQVACTGQQTPIAIDSDHSHAADLSCLELAHYYDHNILSPSRAHFLFKSPQTSGRCDLLSHSETEHDLSRGGSQHEGNTGVDTLMWSSSMSQIFNSGDHLRHISNVSVKSPRYRQVCALPHCQETSAATDTMFLSDSYHTITRSHNEVERPRIRRAAEYLLPAYKVRMSHPPFKTEDGRFSNWRMAALDINFEQVPFTGFSRPYMLY